MKLEYTPFERQIAFHTSPAKFRFYGGAAGGGKTLAMFHEVICQILEGEKRNVPISGLILRRTYPELERTHIRLFREKIPDKLAKYNENKHTAIFPHNSTLEFGYCESDSDIRNYMSAEYDFICIDEMTQFTEYQFKMLLTRLRSTKPGVIPNFFGASNPGDVGHAWVKRLFIDKNFSNEERIAGFTPDMFEFIPSRVFDNTFLMANDPLYIINLRQLPEKQRLSMLDGNWDAFEGQFFNEFAREVHVIKPFTIPDNWERYICGDYGYSAPSAIYWLAIEPQDGSLYVYRELYENNLTAKQLCGKIKALTGENEKISRVVFDPHCWDKRDSDKSLADIFWSNGVFAVKGNNNRIAGANLMREYLKIFKGPDERLTARLKFFSNCSELIRTLPDLIHDKKKPEDCDCFVKGTKILTPNGEINVEDIKVGDMVDTPIGARKVIKAGPSGISERVIKIFLSNGKELEGTANHKVFVQGKGLIELQLLTKSDILGEKNNTDIELQWQIKKLFTKGLNTLFQQNKKNFAIFGIGQKREKSFLGKMQQKCENEHQKEGSRAEIVELLLKQNQIKKNSVQKNASIRQGLKDNLPKFAKSAIRSLEQLIKKQLPVHINAVGNYAEKIVYKLTVDDAHLYYANGVLVTNTHGEDHCLLCDTLILTNTGYKKIIDIEPREKVLTRKGFQEVLKSNKTFENVKCYEVETSVGKLIGTANHPIFLSDGSIKQLFDLKEGDKLVDMRVEVVIHLAIWKLKSFLQRFKNLTVDAITCVDYIFSGKALGSIKLFGNILMEKLQIFFMFITRMETEPTINLPILSYCPNTFTYQNTPRNVPQKELNAGKETDKNLLFGTSQKRGEPGIEFMENKPGKTGKNLLNHVSFAEENIEPLFRVALNFAMTIAKRLHFVPDVLVKKVKFHSIADVYNLTVKNYPEFICGQILVHNSYDSLRYGIMSTEYEVEPEKDYSHLEAQINPETGYVDKQMEYIDA